MKPKKQKHTSRFDKILIAGAVLWGASAALPISAAFKEDDIKVAEVAESLDHEVYETAKEVHVPSYYGVEDIIKLASYIVLSEMSYSDNPAGPDEGTCEDLALEVYRTYFALIKDRKNADLANRVKVVKGFVEDRFEFGGHSWIEYLSYGKWHKLEVTSDFLSEDDLEVPDFVEKIRTLFPDSGMIDLKDRHYYPLIESRFEAESKSKIDNGKLKFVPSGYALLRAPYLTPKIIFNLMLNKLSQE